ncbi:MAG: LysR substrate-binding domain-containing protein [Cyanobacteria bacterium J06635_15]
MDDFNAIFLFLQVAEHQGFTATAKALEMPKSTVSLKIHELEQRLKVQLFHRTTRRVSLTEAGRLFYENCQPMMTAVMEGKAAIAALQGEPQGTLRISAPVLFTQQFLAPVLPQFLARYPQVRVVLHAMNERIDLLKAGYDLAIRVGELADSSFAFQPVASVRLQLMASPEYLKTHTMPTQVDDLKHHQLLSLGSTHKQRVWRLENPNRETYTLEFEPQLASNDVAPILHAMLAGLGIGLLPEVLCQTVLSQQRLLPVLPNWASRPVNINALYPSRKHLPRKVQVFLEFLKTAIKKNDPSPKSLYPRAKR